MGKLIYKPLGLALGVAGGVIAGAVFKRVWRGLADEDEAPNATDEDRGWSEVLLAAALQGAIVAVIKAAVDRGGAAGVRKLTGSWPAS